MKKFFLTTILTLALLVAVGAMAQKTSETPARSGQEPSGSSGMKSMSPGMMDKDMMAMMMQCMKMMEGMMGDGEMKGSSMPNGAGVMGGRMSSQKMENAGSPE